MVAITGSDTYFTNIDSAFTATKWEACIDTAIDLINGYLRDDVLPNMSGSAGSKTVSVTSYQAGFIRSIAVANYAKTKTAGATSSSFNVGGISQSQSNTSGGVNSSPEELAKEAAAYLTEQEVSYG